MPLILDRRRFLQSALAAGASTALLPATVGQARVALFSDTHIAADPNDNFRGFYPHRNLKQVCGQLAQSHHDMLLINGDLARKSGQVADYAALEPFIDPLAERTPMVVSLGNHDDRKNARSGIANRRGKLQSVEQKLVSTIDAGPVQFVVLDSLMVTNIAAGQLGAKQRAWLRHYILTPTRKPIVVFVHHNPDVDNDNALVDAALLLPILTGNKNVKALFFGHTHVYKITQMEGMHLVNLPAVGYNFADGNPVGWVDSIFTGDGVRLVLRANTGETKDDGKATELPWRS